MTQLKKICYPIFSVQESQETTQDSQFYYDELSDNGVRIHRIPDIMFLNVQGVKFLFKSEV